MPPAPKRPCSTPGCPQVTRARYCPQHEQQAHVEDRVRRGSASARGYGAEWQRVRAHHLALEPLCRLCLAEGRTVPGYVVDHLVSRSRGGTDDEWNLRTLCQSCHNRKTASHDGGFGNRGRE